MGVLERLERWLGDAFFGLGAVTYKEFLHVLRDPSTRFVFMIPVMQMVMFGYALRMEVEHIRLGVADQDNTPESRAMIAGFDNTRTFDLTERVTDIEALRAGVVAGRFQVGLLLPQGFATDVARGDVSRALVLVDGSNSTVATAGLNAAVGVARYQAQRLRETVPAPRELSRLPPTAPAAALEFRVRLLFNPNLRSPVFFVPALLAIILQMTTVLLTAFAIVRERENGTFEQLMVTPVGPWGFLVGKIVPYALLSIVVTGMVLLIMTQIFRVPIAGSLPLLLALALLFSVASLSLGLIVSTTSTTQAEAMQKAMFLMLPSILLSGFVFPLDSIPGPLQPITYLIPARYFVAISRGIIVRGAGLEDLWFEVLALHVYTLALLTIGVLRFRKRME